MDFTPTDHLGGRKALKKVAAPAHAVEAAFSPYAFESIPEVLNAFVAFKKERNPRWSTRAWAKRIGFKTPSALVNILKGRRLPDRKVLGALNDTMGLDLKAGDFVAALFERDLVRRDGRAVDMGLRRRIEYLRKFHAVPMLSRTDMNYIGSLLSHLICTLVGMDGFVEDSEWIRSKIRIDTTDAEIEATLKALVYVGLLRRDGRGKLVPTHHFYETPVGAAEKKARDCHVQAIDLAKKSVRGLSLDERFLNWQMFTIRPERYAEATEFLRRIRQEFAALFSEDGPGADSVYLLNLQFVPLTKKSVSRGSHECS
jgi:uncharacterized protein (TIGR02147 family)